MSLAIYNPTQAVLKLKGCNTPAKCMTSGTPALAEIRKEKGEDSTLTALELWIVDANEFFNLPRPMGPSQISQTAIMLLSDFYYFRIADINLVFTRAKKGQYGELYGSLDGMKIYSWFEQYDNERSQIAYSDALREHDNLKSQNKELR